MLLLSHVVLFDTFWWTWNNVVGGGKLRNFSFASIWAPPRAIKWKMCCGINRDNPSKTFSWVERSEDICFMSSCARTPFWFRTNEEIILNIYFDIFRIFEVKLMLRWKFFTLHWIQIWKWRKKNSEILFDSHSNYFIQSLCCLESQQTVDKIACLGLLCRMLLMLIFHISTATSQQTLAWTSENSTTTESVVR